MEQLASLRQCPLFFDIDAGDIRPMLGCLGARPRRYQRGEVILEEGAPAERMGILLSGSAQVERTDYYGNRSIMGTVSPAELFGETFACAGVEELPVQVVATADSEALLIDARRITQTCGNACSFHNQMVYNLLRIVAEKNLQFHRRMEITSRRSTREKLTAFLLQQAKEQGSPRFTIPYDRQELADFLEVDRSGLSTEIGKLRKEGLIRCRKNEFELLNGFGDELE